MLEDELREMFAARVRTAPAADNPAGVAIRRGRRSRRRRTVAAGTAALVFCVTALGLGTGWRGTTRGGQDMLAVQDVTYASLFGDGDGLAYGPSPKLVGTRTMDLRMGVDLWTSDGEHLILGGLDEVTRVIRVRGGWIYSDEAHVRMLNSSGASVPLISGTSWTVDSGGDRLATVHEQQLTVQPLPGSENVSVTSTTVPTGTEPVAFVGTHVVLSSEESGHDHWSTEETPYRETWEGDLLAVYGSPESATVGLRMLDGLACLVEVVPKAQGFDADELLACGGVLVGQRKIIESPDARWLAVSGDFGLYLIDIEATRTVAKAQRAKPEPSRVAPIVAVTCPHEKDASFAWADTSTVLTADGPGLLACKIDGTRVSVTLPEGIKAGWEIVPAYGLGNEK